MESFRDRPSGGLSGPGLLSAMSRNSIRMVLWMMTLAVFAHAKGAEAEYQSRGKRDPFVPLLTEDGRRIHPPGLDEQTGLIASGLNLQGVVLGKGRDSFAVINDRIFREQEEMEGIKVLKIEPNRVTILMDGQEVELTVHQPTEETSTP